MLTVGPRIILRPIAFISSPIAWPTLRAIAGSQVAATAIPAGKAVLLKRWAGDALVIAELPRQDLIPIGPSAILIGGIPSRGMAALSIHPAPLNMLALSSSVMRLRRS